MPDVSDSVGEESIRKRYRRIGTNLAKLIAMDGRGDPRDAGKMDAVVAEIFSDGIELIGQFLVDVHSINLSLDAIHTELLGRD